jgi:hypothetical protein
MSIESFVSCLTLRFIFYYSSLQLMSQFLWTLDAEPQLDITRPAHRHVYCGRRHFSSHDILLAASWRSANNADSISLSATTFSETIYIYLPNHFEALHPGSQQASSSMYAPDSEFQSTSKHEIRVQLCTTWSSSRLHLLQYYSSSMTLLQQSICIILLWFCSPKQQTFSFNDLQQVIIYVPADWVCGCDISRGFLEDLQQLERDS